LDDANPREEIVPEDLQSEPPATPRAYMIPAVQRMRWYVSNSIAQYKQVTSRNERLIYQEVSFQAILQAGAMSFMAVFLVRLGSPNWLVGLYTSLPALVAIFVALPVGSFVQGRGNLVTTANWSRLIFRTTVGLFALLPFLPPHIAPYVLVGARAIVEVPSEASNVSFTTILGMVTPPKTRPRMLSMRLAVNGLVAAVVGFLAGQWLDFAPYPLNYQVLFISAFIAGLASIYTLSHLQLPQATARTAPTGPRIRFKDIPALIQRTPKFRNYAIAAFIFRMAMAMPSALYSIYRVRTLGASDAWIGVLLTVERVLNVGVYFGLGRLLSRPSIRRWLWISCAGAALYPFTMALAKTPEQLLVSVVCGGIFGAGMNVFMTNALFAVSPEDQRPTFVSANAFLTSITSFIAPMMGTALADLLTINLALMIIAGLRVLGGLSFWWMKVGMED
jgi:hypothetical protein